MTDHGRAARVLDPALAPVLDWWSANARDLPWRATRDVYGVWVAEVMSAQTTVRRAADAWVRWMARWPTVDALASASLAQVLGEWQGLGYPRRARDLHRSARIVVTSGWPDDLTELPGIGTYVAAAIRCFALEEPVLPKDVNVTRVLGRRYPHGVDISGDPWRARPGDHGVRAAHLPPDPGLRRAVRCESAAVVRASRVRRQARAGASRATRAAFASGAGNSWR